MKQTRVPKQPGYLSLSSMRDILVSTRRGMLLPLCPFPEMLEVIIKLTTLDTEGVEELDKKTSTISTLRVSILRRPRWSTIDLRVCFSGHSSLGGQLTL
jgi:hypothetical protein